MLDFPIDERVRPQFPVNSSLEKKVISNPSIVFIDPTVEHIKTLIQGVTSTAQVVVLDSDRDGVKQITEILQSKIISHSIHILSHGAPGLMYLGNTELSLSTLEQYRDDLKTWNSCAPTLSDFPSLMLYGCNLASGDAGSEFLDYLYRLTHLPLYASQATVGNKNWELEVAVGAKYSTPDMPFTRKMRSMYTGTFDAQLVRDINPGGDGSYVSGYNSSVVGNQLFFTAGDGVNGRELWVSDGTEAGTTLVKDINPGVSDSYYYYAPAPQNLIEAGGQLFFTADDGVNGRELWVSDGTEAGTTLVKDINPGVSDPDYYYYAPTPQDLIQVEGQLFFTADDGVNGRELWVSDGTEAGTTLVKDINPGGSDPYYYTPAPYNLLEVGGQLYFTADDGVNGRELWVSDGTEAGTTLVKDINSGGGDSDVSAFIEVGSQLFFTANDGVNGRELWVSDGTEAGTTLVKDINPGGSDPYYYDPTPYNLIEVGGRLFFTADDGVNGRELWISDGTEAGTTLVKDINPGVTDPYYYYAPAPQSLIEVSGQLFFTADDGVNGRELWVSDGTEAGTTLVKDINPGTTDPYSYAPSPSNLTEVDGQLFFTADDGVNGRELWVSDGTESGTKLVKDINPGDSDTGYYYYYQGPSNFIEAGGRLFFTADDGVNGRELWVSDGTEAGTQMVSDINPGSNGSYPDDLKVVGNQLLFTANDGTNGNELWSINLPSNIISGDETNNILKGTAEDDLINGRGGDDIIRALGSSDTLNGGDDNDVLLGGGGDDVLNGGEDQDTLFGGTGNDKLNGGSGSDQLFGDKGNDTLQGGQGNDSLDGGRGTDTAAFGDLSVSISANLITGLATYDTDAGLTTDQLINIENLSGGNLDDSLTGDGRANVLSGEGGDDLLSGKKGADTLLGGNGQDELRGGTGADDLIGGAGGDSLLGGRDNDVLAGGQGNDVLIGGGGSDLFKFGADIFDDGLGDTDTIQNFQSRDAFDFEEYLSAGGVIDFNRVTPGFLSIDLSGEDTINVFGTQRAINAAEDQLNAL